ncbi:hypothetical protein GTC27_004220 [Salmonella enterica]|nr:hypothetical protein [Salmonella enterica]ECW5367757.1 hypothetical protein [Salmonella enterica subsp. salamae]EDS8440327.1 hypothetical protein [Salmonella enterica subsp. enterica serovar Hvittingfoss]EAR7410685.1 hypothetical protein [Salmonella enterica]EAX2785682.1 hypothetical protein [Salmonella enterica]
MPPGHCGSAYRQTLSLRCKCADDLRYRGPLGKRKISYAKPVFCTDYYPLSVTSGIYPVPT